MTKDSVNTDLLNFLTNATTPFHTVGVMAERLLAAGFAPWSDSSREPIVAGGKYFTVRNDSSLIAFTAGKDVSQGLRLVGAHTDSPNPNFISLCPTKQPFSRLSSLNSC